jgi:hypothetical protein
VIEISAIIQAKVQVDNLYDLTFGHEVEPNKPPPFEEWVILCKCETRFPLPDPRSLMVYPNIYPHLRGRFEAMTCHANTGSIREK